METTAAPLQPPTPPARPRRRRWRWLLWSLVLLVAAVLAAPYAVNLPFVRRQIADAMTEQLGATVRIDEVAFSWFNGIEIAGLEIDNARGFDQTHPFVRLGSLRGRLTWSALWHQRVDLTGRIAGLQIYIDEDDRGRINAREVRGVEIGTGSGPGSRSDRPRASSPRDRQLDLHGWDLRLDFALTGALIEIRRRGELVEALRDVECTLQKEYGDLSFKLRLETKFAALPSGARAGGVSLRADYDAVADRASFECTADDLDLARWQSLAQSLLGPDELTALAGIAKGTLRGRASFGDRPEIALDGLMTVTAPHIAGALVHGMDVRGERWTLRPALTMLSGADAPPPRIDPGFAIELGFLTVRPLTESRQRELFGARPCLGFDVDLDLDALAAFGGPVPELLRGSRGRVMAWGGVPLVTGALPPPSELARAVVADGRVEAGRLVWSGFELAQLGSLFHLRDGQLTGATESATQLNQGPLAMQLRGDLRDLDTAPFDCTIEWKGGHVAGGTIAQLRYLAPLLAGLDANTSDLASGIDLELTLRGPSRMRASENWLQLLNQWSGSGTLQLRDGHFTPAPALRSLLRPLGDLLGPTAGLGDGGQLRFSSFGGGFRMAQGSIELNTMKLFDRGREFGLTGKVGLDGAIDLGFDLSPLLREHKDGQKVLQLLGARREGLQARLRGSLDQPSFAVPDLGPLLRDAVQQGLQDQLQQKGLDLLRKGLDDAFKSRRK